MQLNYEKWIYGLLGDMIRGGASAVTAGFTVSLMDPKDYSIMTGRLWALIGMVFLVHAIMSAMKYLEKNALPEIVTTTTIEERGPRKTITTTGTGDGTVVEKLTEHDSKVTTVVEEVKPPSGG